jgi:hypothetical protein
MMTEARTWAREAIRMIEADFQRSADTHLLPLALPGLPGVELYFKDDPAIPPAASSIGWRARCFSMRYVTAG